MMTTSQADIKTNIMTVNGNDIDDGAADGSDSGSTKQEITTVPPSTNKTNNKTITNNFSNNSNDNNGVSNGSQRAPEVNKRKKIKSRNATAPIPGSNSKDSHLDAWLEACLKDASNTQLSSSSEFLEYNPKPTSSDYTNNIGIGSAMNKNIFSQQPKQSQQQQQQQQFTLSQMYPTSKVNQPQQQQQQQPFANFQPQQQQQFTMRPNVHIPQSMAFSNAFANGGSVNQSFQKSMPNFMKHSNSFNNYNNNNNRFSSSMMLSSSGNGLYQQNDGSQDFTSLPPIVNMLGGGTSELENNSTDVIDGSGGNNPNLIRGFRFSDPCLLNPSDTDSKVSGQNTPDRRNNVPNEMENNKFFSALMEQINLLHETNSKICRNLQETKVDIEVLKHAPQWGLRHRRDSLSGLSTHSQPMVFGGGFGTQSPAPTYHSGAYTPGMMTDVVREVKEAARVREDALLNRVKTMVEERQWSMNESNLRMMRDIEDLKAQLHYLRADRKEFNKRITHLEAENKYMRKMLATLMNGQNIAPGIIYENEMMRGRKTLPHTHSHATRRSRPQPQLHYGTIHHQPVTTHSLSLDEHEEPLHISEATAEIPLSADAQRPSDARNSFSSSDGAGGSVSGGGMAPDVSSQIQSGKDFVSATQAMSPPKFALVSTPSEEGKRKMEHSPHQITDTSLSKQELQQELNSAVAARKEADNRIIALEKLVKKLRVNPSHSIDVARANGGGFSSGGGVGGGDDASDGSNLGVKDTTGVMPPHYIKWHPHPQTQNNPDLSFTQNSKNLHQHQALTIASTASVTMLSSPPKLSVAGPITDL